MRPIDEIIVHCSATREGQDFTVADIRSWHLERKWKDIGYHFVIYRDGSVHAGRPVSQRGAHVAGRNARTIGVCYIGGVAKDGRTAKDTRTAEQKTALVRLLRELAQTYPSITKISGHRDYANKACPSFNATREYRNLIKSVRAEDGAAIQPDVEPTEDGQRYRVNTDQANFRADPGGRIKGSVPKNTLVAATGSLSGGWIEVRTPAGYVGWVHGSLLDEADQPVAEPTQPPAEKSGTKTGVVIGVIVSMIAAAAAAMGLGGEELVNSILEALQ